MRRLVLYAVAILVGGFSVIVAWNVSDARVGFITIGVCVVGGLVWVAQGLPKIGRPDLRRAAGMMLIGSIAVAFFIPSTRVLCDCPMPQDAVRDCVCPIDHHLMVRIWIVAFGLLVAAVLALSSHFEEAQADSGASRGEPK
jgi:hypothetical protein